MKRSDFDPLCHELLYRYVKVVCVDGRTLLGYLLARDDDPVEADLGRFEIGNGYGNGSRVPLVASKTKAIIRMD